MYGTTDIDDGATIDSSGTLTLGDVALDGPVRDAVDLSKRLGSTQRALKCAATQWYRFATGRLETASP